MHSCHHSWCYDASKNGYGHLGPFKLIIPKNLGNTIKKPNSFNYLSPYLLKLVLNLPGHLPNELSVHQWSGRPGFNPRSSHTKD